MIKKWTLVRKIRREGQFSGNVCYEVFFFFGFQGLEDQI